MEPLEIKCPCCQAVIVINPENGNILKFESPKKQPAEFGDFLEKQKTRKDELARKFESAKTKSRERLKNIEEKIALKRKALDNGQDSS